MTSASVNNIAKAVMQGMYAAKGTEAKGGMNDSFSVLMGQQTKNCSDVSENYPQAARTERENVYQEKQTANETEQTDKGNKTDNVSKTDKLSDSKEQIRDREEQLKEKIAGQLGISVEDLEKAMAELGLVLTDLMDASNMVALVSSVTPAMDAVTVMTDEVTFAQVTELTQMVTDVLSETAEELGISVEELTDFMEAMEPVTEEVEIEVPKEVMETEPAQRKVTYIVESNSEKTEYTTEENDRQPVTTDVVPKSQMAEEAKEQGAGQQNLTGNTPQMETSNFSNTANVQETPNTTYTELARTQEILDQIAEYVKVNARPEVTEMEIQLNPSSLGTVNLQVAAKDGVITAQLITQNEAVRQALETQAFVLKDNLEQQGIKVEAVEVTIASHEFERNLEQGTGQNDAEQAYEEQLKKGTRRINLDGMSEEEIEEMTDEMSEAEMIQIDMMNRSGNKIDFMA